LKDEEEENFYIDCLLPVRTGEELLRYARLLSMYGSHETSTLQTKYPTSIKKQRSRQLPPKISHRIPKVRLIIAAYGLEPNAAMHRSSDIRFSKKIVMLPEFESGEGLTVLGRVRTSLRTQR
jgi:hypothetical protein